MCCPLVVLRVNLITPQRDTLRHTHTLAHTLIIVHRQIDLFGRVEANF